MVKRALLLAPVGIAAAGLLAGCGSGGGSGSGAPVAITAANISFSPTAVSVPAGNVTFTVANNDKIAHNLTIPDAKVNKDVAPGTSGRTTVSLKRGVYQYHCEYHPQKMKGTITVS